MSLRGTPTVLKVQFLIVSTETLKIPFSPYNDE